MREAWKRTRRAGRRGRGASGIAARAAVGVAAAWAVASALAGCGSDGAAMNPSPSVGGGSWAVRAPRPATLTLLPLTRLVHADDGGLLAACHLQLRDEFGHSMKWYGRVRVELYRPGGPSTGPGADSSRGTQDRVWDVDLRDPRENAVFFDDQVTRSYVLRLGGVPDWVGQWSRRAGNDAGISGSPVLLAYFTFVDADGRERTLKAEKRLEPAG